MISSKLYSNQENKGKNSKIIVDVNNLNNIFEIKKYFTIFLS